MPRCTLIQVRWIATGGSGLPTKLVTAQEAVLLKEGDRYSIYNPADDNELVRGMTDWMLNWLIEKGHLCLTA